MELVFRRVPAEYGKPVYVNLLGDIQWSGTTGPTAKDLLKRHVDRCLELNCWFIGMGDYIDFMSPSNRIRLKSAALYDTAEDVIDAKALDLTQELFDLFLRGTKGRWLGMLEGHHFVELRTGDTTDMRLCQLLDAPFLGTSAYVNMQLKTDRSTHEHCTFWVHHGAGGGQTAGASLNKLQGIAASFERADVYAMGHCTKLATDRIQKPHPVWNARGGPKLRHRDVLLVVAGGFMATYRQGSKVGRIPRGGYGEKAMYRPSAIASPIIQITPARRRVDGVQEAFIDMRVIT